MFDQNPGRNQNFAPNSGSSDPHCGNPGWFTHDDCWHRGGLRPNGIPEMSNAARQINFSLPKCPGLTVCPTFPVFLPADNLPSASPKHPFPLSPHSRSYSYARTESDGLSLRVADPNLNLTDDHFRNADDFGYSRPTAVKLKIVGHWNHSRSADVKVNNTGSDTELEITCRDGLTRVVHLAK